MSPQETLAAELKKLEALLLVPDVHKSKQLLELVGQLRSTRPSSQSASKQTIRRTSDRDKAGPTTKNSESTRLPSEAGQSVTPLGSSISRSLLGLR